jgi:hypothetical protein
MGASEIERARDRKNMIPFKIVCRQYLDIHYNTGYRLRRDGEFPIEVVTLGGRFFCRAVDIEAYTHRQIAV